MEFKLEKNKEVQIEVGDVLVGSDDKVYFVAERTMDDVFPFKIIRFEDGIEINGYKSLEYLNECREIKSSKEIKVTKVVKNKDVLITLRGEQ